MPYYQPMAHPWRFMGNSGELIVRRDSCRQTPLILTMTVATAVPTIVRISASGRVGLYPTSQFPYTVAFQIPDSRQRAARVLIETDAPAARVYDMAPRRATHDFFPNARMYVSEPKAQYL